MAGTDGATTLAELLDSAPAPELALQPQQLPPPPTPATAGKRRGRPPGSRNKEKPPVVIVRESKAAMRPVVLELAAGCDVAGALEGFARRRGVGVSVLCGRGALSAVKLRLSTSPVTLQAVKLEGRLEVLSLSGTVLPSSANAAGEGDVSPPPFTVALAGGGGQVIGGTLAGEMTAAEGGMVVVAATFGNAEVHRFPAVDADEERADDGCTEEERHPRPPPPPVRAPAPQLQLKQEQAMVAASADAEADVGHVAAYGGGSGWGGGYPGQVGHYPQQPADQLLPWGQFAESGGPSHPSNYHYL